MMLTGWIHVGKGNMLYRGQDHGVKFKVTGVISVFDLILAVFLQRVELLLHGNVHSGPLHNFLEAVF